jgi:Family of unknown function (DUF5335)
MAMAVRALDKSEWKAFCDEISKTVGGKRAEIEVASLGLGSQVEAKWLLLLGIAYDPKNDLVEIALDDLDHLIHHPRQIYVDIGPEGLSSLEVIDSEDVRHIIKLRDPLALPAPSAAPASASSERMRQR